jgi:hypothetical protein
MASGDEHASTCLKKRLKNVKMLMLHARPSFRIGNREVLDGLQGNVREMPVIQALNLPVIRLRPFGKTTFNVAPNHRATVTYYIRSEPRYQPTDCMQYTEWQSRE